MPKHLQTAGQREEASPVIRVGRLALAPGQTAEDALALALHRLRLQKSQLRSWQVVKQSVDARDKSSIKLVYTLDLAVDAPEDRLVAKYAKLGVSRTPVRQLLSIPKATVKIRPVVVGLGPCGLMAALYLAKAGLKPLVLERGQAVQQRGRAVNALMARGQLDEESNFQFGEGGAGAFSDGKLSTGTKDPLIRDVLEILVANGAPEHILWLQRPHIGTDKLPLVVSSIRRQIEALGGRVLFSAKLTGLHLENGRLRGLRYMQDGAEIEQDCKALVLAIGHSARDSLTMLHHQGMLLAPKPFSLGLRIEHPQSLIDRAQYGTQADLTLLPRAEYHLAHRLQDGRGAYSFCMCPGGRVLPAASEPGGVCVNGMSNSRRDGPNANAALLVEVRPEDYLQQGDPLSGFAFQRKYEQLAYQLGGGGYIAPCQLVGDFLQGQPSTALGSVQPSYRPGVKPGDLRQVLPPYVAEGIRQAILAFDRKLSGFAIPDAVLTGVEARSSCPVQAHRDQNGQSNIKGLFPAGEGAGRAGGIMSAAVDGLRTAISLLKLAEQGLL